MKILKPWGPSPHRRDGSSRSASFSLPRDGDGEAIELAVRNSALWRRSTQLPLAASVSWAHILGWVQDVDIYTYYESKSQECRPPRKRRAG